MTGAMQAHQESRPFLMVAGLALIVSSAGILAGCNAAPAAEQEPTWIQATDEDREQVIARHFRGMDVAMLEIDHRFTELYFAGQDGNWDYAGHQVEHMEEALDLALERRPRRAPSARGHFFPAMARMEAAVEAEDPAGFEQAFEGLRRACNSCHEAEDEHGMRVGTPTQRRTNIVGALQP